MLSLFELLERHSNSIDNYLKSIKLYEFNHGNVFYTISCDYYSGYYYIFCNDDPNVTLISLDKRFGMFNSKGDLGYFEPYSYLYWGFIDNAGKLTQTECANIEDAFVQISLKYL